MAGPAAAESLHIRPVERADRPQWGRMWSGYLAFYKTELPEGMYDLAFDRLLSGTAGEFSGLIATLGGKTVGLLHYLFHRHGWRQDQVCYRQDLYTDPAARGQGVGAALINAVYAEADKAGAPSVYWLTQEGNETARKLYDRIATETDFIKYQRSL
ncbi:N-acetyltransferase family protein [Pseudooceanicola sp.]|uniref:N-acetyltransferase family protein n=1 Tax=Pseudooceanicola sp. TaxID=1914328 RepID=UPI004058C645